MRELRAGDRSLRCRRGNRECERRLSETVCLRRWVESRVPLPVLLLRPDEALHGREIARRTGLSAGTVTRELNRLVAVGLLKREKRGNQQLYSADRSCPVYEEVASILRKTSAMADVLLAALAPASAKIRVAFVYGSMATGRAVAASDVDVMLIGKLGFGEAVDLLYATQQQLGREINPSVFSATEFKRKLRTDAFLQDVMAKPKIFLIGTEDDLAKLVGRQS